eukprot:CFRG1666T1
MKIKEYRVVMPFTVAEYKIAQTYMVARHSHDETAEGGEGFEFTLRETCKDDIHGDGIYTEKKAYLSDKLGPWLKQLVPRVFYVCEKAWNYYPRTHTEYFCSFLPLFFIQVDTVYLNDAGTTENALGLDAESLSVREVCVIDVANRENIPAINKKDVPDLTTFKSKETGRGPFKEGWMTTSEPVMCSYKAVRVAFDVWGMSNIVEANVTKWIQDALVVVHAQAVGWIDEWINLSEEEVREFEEKMRHRMNDKIALTASNAETAQKNGEFDDAAKGIQKTSRAMGLGGQVYNSVSESLGSISDSLSGWWSTAK